MKQKVVKKENKAKYDKFKVKKVKPKPVKKVKPKPVKSVKPKKKSTPKKSTPKTVKVTPEEHDWRLKEVHHDINKVRKAVYDLSINCEGEHDDIVRKVQRCLDRIEIVEGHVVRWKGMETEWAKMVSPLGNIEEKIDAIGKMFPMVQHQIDDIFAIFEKNAKFMDNFIKEMFPHFQSVKAAEESKDTEERVRDFMDKLDSPHWNDDHKEDDDDGR